MIIKYIANIFFIEEWVHHDRLLFWRIQNNTRQLQVKVRGSVATMRVNVCVNLVMSIGSALIEFLLSSPSLPSVRETNNRTHDMLHPSPFTCSVKFVSKHEPVQSRTVFSQAHIDMWLINTIRLVHIHIKLFKIWQKKNNVFCRMIAFFLNGTDQA